MCLQTELYGRVWLAGFHHPGDTVSQACLKELVLAAERITRIRPRRRTELVRRRLQALDKPLARYVRLVCQQEERLTTLVTRDERLTAQIVSAQQQLAHTTIATQPTSPTISCRQTAQTPNRLGVLSDAAQTRLRKRCSSWRQQRERTRQQLQRTQRIAARHQQKIQDLEAERQSLQAWLAQLEADNATNPDAPVCLWRMDAGFAGSENLTWLIEMGYAVETKAPNAKTTTALKKRVTSQTEWTRVGANAEMTAWCNYFVNGYPYPLTVGLERFGWSHSIEYATLIAYHDEPTVPDLAQWFEEYNGRQTIEAGNKEMKGTFKVQHLMSRSPAGIQLQVLFTGLAPNFVRWSAAWLREQVAKPTPKVTELLSSVKTMVRIGANSPAYVQRGAHGATLHFTQASALPGVTLYLAGPRAYQLALPFNHPFEFSSG